MDNTEQVFAEGIAPSGDGWTLSWTGDDCAGVTWLRVTTSEGNTHKGGYASPSIHPDVPVSLYTGSADNVPNGAIVRVAAGATSLVVTTSDGLTQTLGLVAHPTHQGALVAALVYAPGTSIVSVRVIDPEGGHEVPITQPQV